MKTLKLCIILLTCCFSAGTTLDAFSITLPKNYTKNRGKKRLKEAAILWKELDRNGIEKIIRSYIEEMPIVDGVNIKGCGDNLAWTKDIGYVLIRAEQWQHLLSESEQNMRSSAEGKPIIDDVKIKGCDDNPVWIKDARYVIKTGAWRISLRGWEYNFRSLEKIKWNEATLVISMPYNFKTKQLKEEKDGPFGEIRLYCKLRRTGGWFSRKTLHAEFESPDYGEVMVNLPWGGIELRKAPQSSP